MEYLLLMAPRMPEVKTSPSSVNITGYDNVYAPAMPAADTLL